MEPTIVVFFDMFILFGVCNFSSRNRTVGIIDMVRVFIRNEMGVLEIFGSRLPEKAFQ